MIECTVSINQERAILSAINSVNSLGDSIRELLMNSIDSIKDASNGRILVDVKENSITVCDNGTGCSDHRKFTTFRNQSDEDRFISTEGIGLKTMFAFFNRIDIISKHYEREEILRVDDFRIIDSEGNFNPKYSHETIDPTSPIYEDFIAKLKGYNTMIIASQPKEETNISLLFARNTKGNSTTHILNILEEPVLFLEQGGQLSYKNFEGREDFVEYRGFSSEVINFSSDQDFVLHGETIKGIHCDNPEEAVNLKLCISTEPLGNKSFQDIYFGDSKIHKTVSEYVKGYWNSGLRKGSTARIQLRVFLGKYYKTKNLLNLNKHGLKDNERLQKYLVTVLKACESHIRKIDKATSKQVTVKPYSFVEMAKTKTLVDAMSKRWKGNTSIESKCDTIRTCLNELENELQLSQAA